MNGYILKGIGGFYYVRTPDGVVECKPRGLFRKQKITPVAGDEVTLETENGAAVIAAIAPRKNVFVRPPVANLDVLFLVASTTQPTPSTLVLDKLSAIAVDKGGAAGDRLHQGRSVRDCLFAAGLRTFDTAGDLCGLCHRRRAGGTENLDQRASVRLLRQLGRGQVYFAERPCMHADCP